MSLSSLAVKVTGIFPNVVTRSLGGLEITIVGKIVSRTRGGSLSVICTTATLVTPRMIAPVGLERVTVMFSVFSVSMSSMIRMLKVRVVTPEEKSSVPETAV